MRDRSFMVGVCGIIVVIGLVSFMLGDVTRHRTSQKLDQVGAEVVNVIYGDTLWTIAQKHAIPGCSTKDVLLWVEQHNGLTSAHIRPGQHLVVPCGMTDS